MPLRVAFAIGLVLLLTGWRDREPPWPQSGPMPDEAVAVPASGYEPALAGTRSYRPVEPMPWGDVNRRVAPPPTKEPGQPQEDGK